MDTKFSTAIHMLIMIAGADRPVSSEQIAESAGTNASYIRKIAGLLKKQGILESRQGISGFALLTEPEQLSLLKVYQAVAETDRVHVFDLHQNPNDACIVGRHVRPVLSELFREIEEKAEEEVKHTTLADCMGKMRIEIDREERSFRFDLTAARNACHEAVFTVPAQRSSLEADQQGKRTSQNAQPGRVLQKDGAFS